MPMYTTMYSVTPLEWQPLCQKECQILHLKSLCLYLGTGYYLRGGRGATKQEGGGASNVLHPSKMGDSKKGFSHAEGGAQKVSRQL